MVALHGSKARLLLSGYDVSPSMREASAPASVDVSDSSTWGMNSKRYTPSELMDGSLAGSGVWEHTGVTPGSIDDLLASKLGGQHVATYLPQGDVFGSRGWIVGGIESNFEIDSPIDDIVGFSFEIQSGSGVVPRGRVLRPLAGALNISANGNGTTLDDLGAGPPTTTSRGLGAALHVTDKGGGAGTITVKVQHSTDGSAWVDFITFGGKTTADVAEYAEAAGTVNRYLRALWTVTGGTWDIHVAAGRR